MLRHQPRASSPSCVGRALALAPALRGSPSRDPSHVSILPTPFIIFPGLAYSPQTAPACRATDNRAIPASAQHSVFPRGSVRNRRFWLVHLVGMRRSSIRCGAWTRKQRRGWRGAAARVSPPLLLLSLPNAPLRHVLPPAAHAPSSASFYVPGSLLSPSPAAFLSSPTPGD